MGAGAELPGKVHAGDMERGNESTAIERSWASMPCDVNVTRRSMRSQQIQQTRRLRHTSLCGQWLNKQFLLNELQVGHGSIRFDS